MVAHHIEQRKRADHGAKQLGMLRERRAYQQSAVAAAGDGQLLRPGVMVAHQPLRGRDEIIKHVLLLLQHAGVVPLFAELAATPQVGQGKHAAALRPINRLHGKCRRAA